MENMIEHTITAKTIFITIGKPVMALAIVLGFDHVFDFILLQVDQNIILTPYVRELLSETKIILGVIISFLVFIKLALGIKDLLKKKQ